MSGIKRSFVHPAVLDPDHGICSHPGEISGQWPQISTSNAQHREGNGSSFAGRAPGFGRMSGWKQIRLEARGPAAAFLRKGEGSVESSRRSGGSGGSGSSFSCAQRSRSSPSLWARMPSSSWQERRVLPPPPHEPVVLNPRFQAGHVLRPAAYPRATASPATVASTEHIRTCIQRRSQPSQDP